MLVDDHPLRFSFGEMRDLHFPQCIQTSEIFLSSRDQVWLLQGKPVALTLHLHTPLWKGLSAQCALRLLA